MKIRSALRWVSYNLAPQSCPECTGLLSVVLRRTPTEVGAVLRRGDPRTTQPSDWLCCEDCRYAVALDLPSWRPPA